jgi:hypothetical protein
MKLSIELTPEILKDFYQNNSPSSSENVSLSPVISNETIEELKGRGVVKFRCLSIEEIEHRAYHLEPTNPCLLEIGTTCLLNAQKSKRTFTNSIIERCLKLDDNSNLKKWAQNTIIENVCDLLKKTQLIFEVKIEEQGFETFTNALLNPYDGKDVHIYVKKEGPAGYLYQDINNDAGREKSHTKREELVEKESGEDYPDPLWTVGEESDEISIYKPEVIGRGYRENEKPTEKPVEKCTHRSKNCYHPLWAIEKEEEDLAPWRQEALKRQREASKIKGELQSCEVRQFNKIQNGPLPRIYNTKLKQ